MFFKYIQYSFKTIRLYGLIFFIKCVIRRIKTILHCLFTKPKEKIQYSSYLLNFVKNDSAKFNTREMQVDIILPVYNAYNFMEKCIDSVIKNSENCRLILIDDASTDDRVKPYLKQLKNIPEKRIEIITFFNEKNLGFVKSVNLGFQRVENHFVILNSDTEVPPGWLDRIFAPIIDNNKEIASATPFSNCGMICSFPEFNIDNPVFKNLDFEVLDEMFRLYGTSVPIDLPTGVGFCMAFNKKVTDEIGFFDEENFGKGYGEENDWCLRANAAGFKNVMVCDLFVYHKHGASFNSGEKQQLMQDNLHKILKKYPNYIFDIEKFCENDPIEDIRESLKAIIDAHNRNNKMVGVIIDNDFIGGAKTYSDKLTQWLNQGDILTLHIKFNSKEKVLKFLYEGESVNREFIFKEDALDVFEKIMLLFKPDFVMINEFVSWPDPIGVCEKIQQLKLPYFLFIHDFFYICPNWNLVNQHEEFCNIPEDFNTCEKCLAENKNTYNYAFYSGRFNDIAIWREKMKKFLCQAEKIICFSENSLANFIKTYPELENIDVIEHCFFEPEFFQWKQRKYEQKIFNLGVVGGIGFPKGLTLLKKLIEDPLYKKLPINMVIVGKTLLWPDGYSSRKRKISIHGDYQRKELPLLLEKYGINAVLIPSICPETYSFTTSEATKLGYPVICFNLGAPAERIKDCNCGIVIDKVSVEGLLEAFQQIIKKPELIEEYSFNTTNCCYLSEEQHKDKLLEIIKKSS